MQNKKLFRIWPLIILLVPCFCYAGLNGLKAPEFIIVQPSVDCKLSAPESVQVFETGPTWVKVSWTEVQDNSGYEVNTIEAASKLPAGTHTFLSATSVLIEDLTPGTEYRTTVAAKCADGTPSSNFSSATYSIIIVDLTVEKSVPGTFNAVPCGPCEFDLSNFGTFYFGIKRIDGDFVLKFSVEVQYKSSSLRVVVGEVTDKFTPYNLVSSLGTSSCFFPGCVLEEIEVIQGSGTLSPGTLCRFMPKRKYSFKAFIDVDYMEPGYEMVSLGYMQPSPNILKWRSEKPDTETSVENKIVVLNPIRDKLLIQKLSTMTAETELDLSLVDLQGRVLYRGKMQPGQTVFETSVAGLLNGLYFLQVRDGEQSETYKILKQ